MTLKQVDYNINLNFIDNKIKESEDNNRKHFIVRFDQISDNTNLSVKQKLDVLEKELTPYKDTHDVTYSFNIFNQLVVSFVEKPFK